ncbi:DUF3078 domain-containing protein [Reichenbachiella sp.]
MRTLILLFLFISHFSIAQNQDSIRFVEADSLFGWTQNGDVDFNFSNVGLKNWNGGGESALALSTEIDYSHDFFGAHVIWDNEVDLIFGLTRTEETKEFRKTDDRFELRSLIGRRVSKRTTLSFLAEFRSQLAKGYTYNDSIDVNSKELVSSFLSPGYLNLNLGVTFKKRGMYTLTVSPFTGKFTFVRIDSLAAIGAFGVDPGRHLRFESGSSLNGVFRYELMKGVWYRLQANLFSGYATPTEIDVNLHSSIRIRANEFLTSSISGTLIYDKDVDITRDDGTVGPAVQYSYAVNVGLFFTF